MGIDISKLSPMLEDDYDSECKSDCCIDNKGCSCDSKTAKHHEPHEIKIDKPK